MEPSQWQLGVGQRSTRTSLHERHGGSHSRGISAPARGSGRHDIMLWWRPGRGESFGYEDGWDTGGAAFYFTGTGQVGDQRFDSRNSENGRLRDHEANGDHIRLLRYVGDNEVVYVGQFRLDPADPWQWRDGPDRYGAIRKMIQFRLIPVEKPLRLEADPVREAEAQEPTLVPLETAPRQTPIENLGAIHFEQMLKVQRRIARRSELQLLHHLQGWLAGCGVESGGLLIPYAPERRNLRADLYLPLANTLVEAKANASRESVRMGIGQLLDYARWLKPKPRSLLLLPNAPPEDMVTLLESLTIGLASPSGDGFKVLPQEFIESQ